MTQSTPLATTSFPASSAPPGTFQPDGAGLPVTGRVHPPQLLGATDPHCARSGPHGQGAGREADAGDDLAAGRVEAGGPPRGPRPWQHTAQTPPAPAAMALTGPGFGAVSRAVPASIRSSPALLVTAQTAPARPSGRPPARRCRLGHDQRPPGCRVDPHDQPADGQPDRLRVTADGVDRGAGGNDL